MNTALSHIVFWGDSYIGYLLIILIFFLLVVTNHSGLILQTLLNTNSSFSSHLSLCIFGVDYGFNVRFCFVQI